jgi:hypothetical protein
MTYLLSEASRTALRELLGPGPIEQDARRLLGIVVSLEEALQKAEKEIGT